MIDQYYISSDGHLYGYDDYEYEFKKIDVDLIFNPKQEIIMNFALTEDGRMYDIRDKEIIPIDHIVTSINIINRGRGYSAWVVTKERLLLKVIGRASYTRRASILPEDISILARDIDFILNCSNCMIVISGDKWIKFNFHHTRELLEFDPENPYVDENPEGAFRIGIKYDSDIMENMPTVDAIISSRRDILVTDRGVYSIVDRSSYYNILPSSDILDAIILPESYDYSGQIFVIDREGKLSKCISRVRCYYREDDNNEDDNEDDNEDGIEECDSDLINSLGPWYGFMEISTRNMSRVVGIHNRNGDTYLINRLWMIGSIKVPTEFHLGSMIMKKNPRTRQ